MSGRRWIFALLATIPISATGCQVDGGATKMWNPFVRADKTDVQDDGLPSKFVRRATVDEKEKEEQIDAPVANNRIKALLEEGQRALQENRVTDARQAYAEVLKQEPEEPTAHHGLAMVADLTEQWAEADDHYRQALRSRPRDANLLCDIGYSYLLQNRYSEASSYLSQAIQINPNHENAHTNLVLLDIRQGNREAARQRLMQRYGNPATVTQILTSLESQSASKTATGLATTTPSIPENASFQEIREIANRERIAAEQRRAALNIPTVHNAPIRPGSPASHTIAPTQFGAADLHGTGQQPDRFIGTNIDPAVAGIQAVAGNPSGAAALENYPLNTGAPMPSTLPPQYSGPPAMASQARPLIGNPQMYPASAGTETIAASWNPDSMPPQNAMAQYPISNLQYPTISGQANFSSQRPVSTVDTAPLPANTAPGSGDLIVVRPSGSFQPPNPGVSYGQPFGFGPLPSESAGSRNSGSAVAPAGPMSYANAADGNMNGSAAKMQGQQNPDSGLQYPNAGQSNAQVQIDGLNAGPGSLFPVSQGYSDQGFGNQQYSGHSPTGSKFGMPNESTATIGNTTAPRPGNPAPPVSPLAAYENQLRQLDNQYNNTLQQLDRNAAATVPRARY